MLVLSIYYSWPNNNIKQQQELLLCRNLVCTSFVVQTICRGGAIKISFAVEKYSYSHYTLYLPKYWCEKLDIAYLRYDMFCILGYLTSCFSCCYFMLWLLFRALLLTMLCSVVNRIPVTVPLTGQLLGVIFLRGHISLKNRSLRPLLIERACPFKNMCVHT
jgi:hypothetical protein